MSRMARRQRNESVVHSGGVGGEMSISYTRVTLQPSQCSLWRECLPLEVLLHADDYYNRITNPERSIIIGKTK